MEKTFEEVLGKELVTEIFRNEAQDLINKVLFSGTLGELFGKFEEEIYKAVFHGDFLNVLLSEKYSAVFESKREDVSMYYAIRRCQDIVKFNVKQIIKNVKYNLSNN